MYGYGKEHGRISKVLPRDRLSVDSGPFQPNPHIKFFFVKKNMNTILFYAQIAVSVILIILIAIHFGIDRIVLSIQK